MLHKAKKAYYACDVIRTRTLFTRCQAVAIATWHHCLPSTVTLYRSPGCAVHFSLTWLWRMKSLVKH